MQGHCGYVLTNPSGQLALNGQKQLRFDPSGMGILFGKCTSLFLLWYRCCSNLDLIVVTSRLVISLPCSMPSVVPSVVLKTSVALFSIDFRAFPRQLTSQSERKRKPVKYMVASVISQYYVPSYFNTFFNVFLGAEAVRSKEKGIKRQHSCHNCRKHNDILETILDKGTKQTNKASARIIYSVILLVLDQILTLFSAFR